MAFGLATLSAQAQFVVEMKDGSTVEWNSDANFVQKGSDDTWSLSGSQTYDAAADISLIKGISVAPLQTRFDNYSAPSYVDYYLNVASWENRSRWNLANVHDPSVMRAADGYYYMYQTDASYGNAHDGHGHFHCRRSKNLIDWEYMGATMPSLPSWVKPKLNEIRAAMGLGESTVNWNGNEFGYWAPCARMVNKDLYRMYYVITIPGRIDGNNSWSERAFIGLMETSNPADVNSWVDKGYVITNYSDKELNFHVTAYADCYFKYNAIDPSYIITPEGEHWLIYGSWHSGFAALQLNADTGMPLHELGNPWGAANEANYGKRVYTRQLNNRWQASEAPEVIYHDGYYYLFIAYDELAVAYNTRVLRSENIDGPYYSASGINVTERGGVAYPILTHPYKFNDGYGWVGISHCAVFDDGNGNWYFSSQGRFPENAYSNSYSNAVMLGQIRRIVWTEDGWPLVLPERYGAVPQTPITEEELVGEWEHINLSYSFANQRTSVSMVLGSDHKVASGWNVGKEWSFDASKGILTLNGQKLYVSRELDWEKTPRTPTIVYTGFNSNGSGNITFWGKRVAEVEEPPVDENTTVVGNTDCSSTFWSAFSDYYTIPSGKKLHMKFVNHTSGLENWNNWNICLANDNNREASAYAEYFVLRSDLYGWGDENFFNLANITSEGYDGWDAFRVNMEGAVVELTVTREGSTISVEAVATCPNGHVYTERYHQTCGDGSQTVRAFLVADGSYMVIDNTATYVE